MPRDDGAEGGPPGPAPSAPTEAMPEGVLAPGQVLGDRYQIRSQLGRGGMGEVWRAFDLKLRVEVALKALLPDLFKDERRRDLLRREVRAAREVVSPNVCRIFDLIEADGSELVSMEYVDGGTLLEVLQERGPLELKEAQDIASQFLAGLEAIHKAGLVHRDVKPENIMLTRAGRVVLMDFGLARQEDSGAGTVSGTPAYMAPEQAMGGKVDARADVYSAGVVLAEMVSPEGIKNLQSRQSVWEGIRHEPARVPDSPWAPVLKKAVAKEPDQRYNSAHTLTRALEDVTLRVEGAEDLTPYPGLASFTEEDAEYFFGREAEVEQMWSKLDLPHLLGLIGPSGAGKSSFVRAGLLAAAPPGWTCLVCTPGNVPVLSLGRALARAMTGDTEIVEQMLSFDDPDVAVDVVSRWRNRAGNGLLVVDQFEELFTLNAEDVQRRFAELLGRLAIEADVHVLISMRDDFLFRCSDQPALAPVFSELTPLRPPAGAALRRAVIQPAMKCGYRFEDDELVEEMLGEVEGERGALPLLAFAMARLWEKRDRDNGLLTRQAYHDIGGVGGALARHAEETIDRIGTDRIAIVREIFRNLVTAEGTRAVREWDELLSVFSDSRGESQEVLRKLIDARLLTSYEIQEEGEEPTRRVEIIHESLLANWPRLVRWQMQDEEGAQLRDELRHAARSWDDHGRQNDRLWTGTAFREYTLWRERYPGGLTNLEEAFGAAMTSFAGRRRRRRRFAAVAALVVFATVATIFAALWRHSRVQERRAEAQKLIAMGQLRLEDHPTAAMVYAAASLELRDTYEARLLALRALWQGPTYFVVNEHPSISCDFSPSGEWLVQTHEASNTMHIIGRDGSQRLVERPSETGKTRSNVWFRDHRDLFVSNGDGSDLGRVALWSASEGRLLAAGELQHAFDYGPLVAIVGDDGASRALLTTFGGGELVSVDALYADGRHEQIGQIHLETPIAEGSRLCMPRSSPWLALVDGREVSVVEIGASGLSERRLLGTRAEGDPTGLCAADPLERFVLIPLASGKVEVWDPAGELPPSSFDGPPGGRVGFSWDGSHVMGWSSRSHDGEFVRDIWIWSIEGRTFRLRRKIEGIKLSDREIDFDPNQLQIAARGPFPDNRLWPLTGPSSAEPILLRRGPAGYVQMVRFSPDGQWLATNHATSGLAMWPLVGPLQRVKRMDLNFFIGGLTFGPQGRFLAYLADTTVFVTPLEGAIPVEEHVVFQLRALGYSSAVSPDGSRFAVGAGGAALWIGADDGAGPTQLKGSEEWPPGPIRVAFGPNGRLVAFLTGYVDLSTARVLVWDLDSNGVIASLALPGEEFRFGVAFSDDGRLLTATTKGVVAWDVRSGDSEVLAEGRTLSFAASRDGRRLVVTEEGSAGIQGDPAGPPVYFDLDSGQTTTLSTHGLSVLPMALDREGEIAVTGDRNGIVRVGPVTGEEPHLLLGHEGKVRRVAIDPSGRWIASGGEDDTVRLWPMPDLSKPPLHTLPHEELIAKLKTLTNLRVVRDEDSPTGWKLTHDPFPGWETVPTW